MSPDTRARLTSAIATAIAAKAVEVTFCDRKGHGGGPISRRVLWPNELEEIVRVAVAAGINHFNNVTEPAE